MTAYALEGNTDTSSWVVEQTSRVDVDEYPSRPVNALLRTPKLVTSNCVQTEDFGETGAVSRFVFQSALANVYVDSNVIMRLSQFGRKLQPAKRERGIYSSTNEYYESSDIWGLLHTTRAIQPTERDREIVFVYDEADSNLASDFWFTNTLSTKEVSVVAVQADMLNVSHYPAVDPLNIELQIAGMRHLEDGWADGMQSAEQWSRGYGKALSAEGLDWISSQFDLHYAQHLSRPYLYPTPEGGIQAEWSIGPYEASIEIDILQHIGYWHCFDIENSKSTERSFDLDQADSWHWIALEILRLERNSE